jgi:hypothetical protein
MVTLIPVRRVPLHLFTFRNVWSEKSENVKQHPSYFRVSVFGDGNGIRYSAFVIRVSVFGDRDPVPVAAPVPVAVPETRPCFCLEMGSEFGSRLSRFGNRNGNRHRNGNRYRHRLGLRNRYGIRPSRIGHRPSPFGF